MPVWSWKGADPRGRSTGGSVVASSLGEAAAGLRARGLSPLVLERGDPEAAIRPHVTADAFTMFNRNLAEMTAVGLPLPRAIREFASGLRGGRFKRALERVEAAMRDGKTLDEAVAEDPGVFPPYYRWMLQAGAASGNLSAMLSAVARNAEGFRMARRAFLEAIIYPLLVVMVSMLVTALAMTLFVPFYRELSASHDVDMPGLSTFLHSMETTFRVGTVVVGSAAALFLGGAFLLRSSWGERILRSLPLVGRIRRHLLQARLLGAMGVMLRAGVPLPKAVPVALGAAGSRELRRAADELGALASEGLGLGEVLARAPGVSSEVAEFLGLAERTGDAPHATVQVAELLMEQALADSEALFILLMPAALLVAGVLVGGLLVSVVHPYIIFLESLHS
ncbi:MAG TPA: type II secretion system F family protein [Planctomycetota bacterium]|nr:type II secretion system F family protein [Planctomycetota bacterium]